MRPRALKPPEAWSYDCRWIAEAAGSRAVSFFDPLSAFGRGSGDFASESSRARDALRELELVGALDVRRAADARACRPGADGVPAAARPRAVYPPPDAGDVIIDVPGESPSDVTADEPGFGNGTDTADVADIGPETGQGPGEGEAVRKVPSFEIWRKTLLNLTNKNNFLSFRSGKGHVDLAVADLQSLEERLEAGKSFDFVAGLELLAESGGPGWRPPGDRASFREALLPFAGGDKTKNALVALHGAKDLKERLRKLARDSRTLMEEGGSNVLFVAMGFLVWLDAKTEREAPLVLVPVSISRSGPGPRYRIAMLGDEPRFNLTLIEKLGLELGLRDLDDLAGELPRAGGKDKDCLDLKAILDRTAAALGAFPGWRVTHRVTVGMFSFAKHLMWKDLGDLKKRGQFDRHPILNLLLNKASPNGSGTWDGSGSWGGGPVSSPAPDELDERLQPSEEYLPLRADSSQLAAVARAGAGGTFVLIGPPGTGKSQTIANLIAQCIATGKAVLFVAEKAAALNVVHRRLKACGLEPFCLELHSHRSDRKEVLRQLNLAVQEPESSPMPEWGGLSGRIANGRDSLNAYAEAVHREYPSGYSIFKAVGASLGSLNSTGIALGGRAEGEGALSLTRDQLEELVSTASNLALLRPDVRGLGGIMRFLRATHSTPIWQVKLHVAAEALKEAWGGLEKFEAKLGRLADPGLSRTPLLRAETVIGLAENLPPGRDGSLAFAFRGRADPERAAIERALALLDETSAIMRELPEAAGGGSGRLGELLESLGGSSAILSSLAGLDVSSIEGAGLEYIAREAEKTGRGLKLAWNVLDTSDADELLSEIRTGLEALAEYREAMERLSADYEPAKALALNLNSLAGNWDSAERACWLLAGARRRRVIRSLTGACRAGGPSCPKGDLGALLSAKKAVARLAELTILNGLYMGQDTPWRGRDTDPEALARFRDLLLRLRATRPSFERDREALLSAGAALRSIIMTADGLAALLKDWKTWGEWGERIRRAAEDAFGPVSAADPELRAEETGRARGDAQQFRVKASEFFGHLGWDGDPDRLSFGDVDRAAKEVLEHRDSIRACVDYLALKERAAGLGLSAFTDALEKGRVRGGEREAADAVVRSFSSNFLIHAVEREGESLSVTGRQREIDLESFARNYAAKLAVAVGQIKGLVRRKGWYDGVPSGEGVTLKRESVKQRKFLPVRKLLAAMPNLTRRAAPCLLMSPMSVAQYLPPDIEPFDLVIFDEASQIPSAEAVGAIARAKRAVVVGDPKQLPPTDFFKKRVEADEDSDEGDEEPLESILDDCRAAGMLEVTLRWHYRSRSEGLISFSNEHYYDGHLVTFPSAAASDRAVSFTQVDGVYGRGGTRTNPIEAKAVAEDVVRLLKSPEADREGFSVAVVTFSAAQQDVIQNILDDFREADPSLERFFDEKGYEPLIVKNLENIQGDERGVVYFSVGYGKDATGNMTQYFGPLNKSGGERRLNVAITRARLAVKVFASFPPEEIKERAGIPVGVAHLRDFMRYAQQRARAAEEGGGDSGAGSRFADFVGDGLEKRGWTVRRGLGLSGFKLDLGVVDPDDPERFLAGVECDGEAFRRASAAVDREILRGEVLAGLGWKIFRVWSRDWWEPTGDEGAERLLDKLHSGLKALRTARAG
ncbi:MAG: DUF4011 domain-containing protein [Deltaproteobacteria bacterium]|nr:DUF4011 domain-containing protein [Deltaproteobacteria bacterium]